MNLLNDKIVLVTGASSGIGEATSRHLAEQGATVVLGARRIDRLNAIVDEITGAGHTAVARRLDVTDLADVQAFVDFAIQRFGRVDAIVNNAGVMPLSNLDVLKVDEWDRMIDVNIRGVLHGIAAALPVFRRQGGGHVVNLSSIGGHMVFPTAAVYCATKFAVGAISEGLRQEARHVRVTVISPGPTASELADSITDSHAAGWVAGFRDTLLPADSIARAIAYALEQPADVDVNEIVVRPTASAA
ncbi:MAG: SDR family oxidoreductase [Phycisphaerae bacterium]